MTGYKCLVEYDGTGFNGWGKQPGQRTVQGEIEKALSKIFDTDTFITCAGRTDKGVHACGQVISFKAAAINTDKLLIRANSLLPNDISLKTAETAPEDFDARKSAKFKTYRYLIHNTAFKSPLSQRRAWHISKPLDIKKMRKAAAFLQKKREYAIFDSYNSIFDYKTVDLRKVTVERKKEFFIISVTGDRFLYKMIRKMAGEIVRIGKGEQTPEKLEKAVKTSDKSMIGKPAPAHGLYLAKITY